MARTGIEKPHSDPSGRRPFTAVILNGGSASRYGGADKQALLIGVMPIGRALASSLRNEAEELLVIGRPHAMYDDLADGQYEDSQKGRGPLEGLYGAMRRASHARILLCAADMPFVSLSLIRRLFDIATRGGAEIVLCEFNGVYQPFSAFYRRDLMSDIAVHLALNPTSSLWSFIRRRRYELLRSDEVSMVCDGDFAFQNINDPASYERAVDAALHHGFLHEARI